MANPQKIRATVSSIITFGDGVYAVSFVTERLLPKIKPGQFLHLALDEYDPSVGFWPESRVFSVSEFLSSTALSIVYSVKGIFTSRMAHELTIGKSVWLKLPYGNFVIDDLSDSSDPIILVAGGTGITPFVSFLDGIRKSLETRRIQLFYGMRKPSLLLFPDLIQSLSHGNPNVRISLYIESEEEKCIFPCTKGIIKSEAIRIAYNETAATAIFIAGPPAMIKAIKEGCQKDGILEYRIFTDEWE